MRLAAALVALLLFAEGAALARPHKRVHRPKTPATVGSEAEGRAHLKKAATLSSHGDCQAAIDEYVIAFDRLNDPAILLARADCRQKLGQNAEAIDDYRAYLDESPDVVNRAEIEAKIAALEGGAARETPAASSPPPRESGTAKEAARPKESTRPPESASPVPPPPPLAPAPAEAEAPPAPHPLVGPVVTSAGATGETGGHGRLWLWTTVGVLVAGGAAAAGYFYFQPKQPTPPATELGNYHF